MVSEQRVIIGNCLDVLRGMPDESIDMVITSPPYWALRDYGSAPVIWGGEKSCNHQWGEHIEPARGGVNESANVRANRKGEANINHPTVSHYCSKCGAWKGQLGLEPSPIQYVDHLMLIFDEVKRVLKSTGACWVNIGDTYATVSGSGFQTDNISAKKERDAISNANEIRKGLGRYGFKEKSLCQIPSRFAIAMTDHGWILRNEIIWHKPNAMPVSTKDRFTVDFEKLYFFVKEPKYFFKQQFEEMKMPTAKTRFPLGKLGNPNPKYSGNEYDAEKLDGKRNMRTVWDINTQANSLEHCAMFPKSLIDIPIKSCCPDGGTVLDPFCGSGTTLEYCFDNDINGIGIEINPAYEGFIKKRAKMNQRRLY